MRRKITIKRLNDLKDQRGVTIIFVALLMVVFIGLSAFAVDIAHLKVVRNELQNAADAGALAGARFLYSFKGQPELDGQAVNPLANQYAHEAATSNISDRTSVEVNWSSGQNTGSDVERGHWSFATRTFTPCDTCVEPPQLWDCTAAELDANSCGPFFVNAVRVRTRRLSTPAVSFFARIFGYGGFPVSTEAIAYIGFAGSLAPKEVDQPIAICREALLDAEGNYTCGVGRMINSGTGNTGHQTGGWTNFTQPPDPGCITASVPTVRPFVCGSGNPNPLTLGVGLGTTGGELQTVFDQFMACWNNPQTGLDLFPPPPNGDGIPDQPWKMTLPVISCEGNNVGPCSIMRGAVELNVVWMTRSGVKNRMEHNNPGDYYPKRMGGIPGVVTDWVCSNPNSPQTCWTEFVDHFHLRDVLNNTPATFEDKTIYFLPDCDAQIPQGTTGGENFGILAKIPVLVNDPLSRTQ